MRSVEQVVTQLREELNVHGHWEGYTFRFSCPGAQGFITLEPGVVSITVRLSGLLTLARSTIEREIAERLDRALHPVTS